VDVKVARDWSIKSAARGEIEAVFSTFRVVDLDGDYTEPGAFTDGATVPIGVWAHGSVLHRLSPAGIGRITTTHTDARVVGRYLLDSDHGRSEFATVKAMHDAGHPLEWSYHYAVEDADTGPAARQLGARRVLKRLRVKEASPCLEGAAGPGRSGTLAAKQHGGRDLEPDEKRWLRDLAGEVRGRTSGDYRELGHRLYARYVANLTRMRDIP
jgi:hypothetical protein